MIAYHPATRLGQQVTASAPGQVTSAPIGIPNWLKIAVGTGLIAAGAAGGYTQDKRRPLAARKSTPEMLAISGSIIGGLWILAEGFGLKL
jgi:hypothetical protein